MKIRITSSVLALAIAGAALLGTPSVTRAADGFTITAPFAGRAVTSCSDFSMSGGVIDSAGVAAGSTAPVNAGNVFTNGNITLSGSSTIKGNVVIGPAKHVTSSGSAAITGTTTNETSTFNCQPIDLVALKNTVSVTNDNSHIPQTTNHHNALVGTNFSMSGTDGITLPAGTYYFTGMTLSGSSVITLSGPVNILVNGSVNISGGSLVSSNGYGLHFWVMGTTFGLSSSTFKAFVYAPSAAATLSSSTLVGGIWANTVSISGSSHMTAAIDDIPPQVAITSPADNSGTSDPAHLVVRGTVSDGQSDVSVKVNGQTAAIAADGTWQITLDVSGSTSPVTITAVATDTGGTTASATIHVVTAVPLVTLTSPIPDSFIPTRTPNLTGSAGTSASVTVNGTPAAIAGGSWSLSGLNLGNDGAHTLTITGTNAAGSTSIHPVLKVDTTPPTVTPQVSPVPNAAHWNKSTATVSFNCVDAGSDVATCTPSVVVSAETAGQTVSGTGVDKVGNPDTESIVVKLDVTAPVVAISTPSAAATVTSATLAVSGTAMDALSGIDDVKCNGATATRGANNSFDCSVTLIAGDNMVTVRATDVAGNSTDMTRHVTYTPDASAPVVTITTPANNSFTKQTTVIVTGTALDDVAVASVTVNGNPVTLSGNSWSTTVTLSGADGVKTITVRATDTSGNPGTATAQITLDTTPPSIDITSPADHVSVNDSTLTVTGTVRDALSGVTGVTCNNVAAAISDTIYRCSVPLVEGDNTITAVATDGAGNSTPATIHATFTADTEAPVITITAPAAGLITKETTLTVSGTVSDDVSVAGVTVNGVPVTFSGGSWTTQVVLTPGDEAKTITAKATDGTGKTSSANVQVTLDTTAPSVAITTPANGSTSTSESLTVSGSVYDLAGLSTVTCNGVNGLIENGTFTCSVTLVPGGNTITATATDKAGNSAESTIHTTYTRDLQAPTIAITAPVAGTVTKERTIVVSGTAADDVAVATVKVEGALVPLDSDGNWTTTVHLNGGDGPKPITASVTDGSGKSNQAQVQIALDTTAPTVAITSPANHSSGTSSSLTVNGSVSDASAITGVTCNGVAATLAGGTFTCVVTLVPGDNTITAAATDAAGNIGTSTVTAAYTPDTLAPSIAITSPANGIFTRSTSVVVTGTAGDDVALARVTVNDVVTDVSGGSWTATVPLTAPDGAKTITAVAFDTTGKTANAAIQVMLDMTAPLVTVTTNLSAPAVTPSLTLSGTIADAGSGIDTLTCNGVAATVGSSGTFTCAVALLEGPNTVTLAATDKIGNQATQTVSVELDTRQPELTVTAPAPGACVGSLQIAVTGHVADPHLASLQIALGNGTPADVVPAAGGTWSGTLTAAGEGRYVVNVTAADRAGFVTTTGIPVTVDTTAPVLSITEGGQPFTGGAFNRTVTPIFRATDAGGGATVTATLNSQPFTSGAAVSAAGDYTLAVSAHDCAGNSAPARSVTFTIDLTAATVASIDPANGSILGAPRAVTGTLSATDVRSVIVSGSSVAAAVNGTSFTFAALPLVEGANAFTFVVTDTAGNVSSYDYAVTLKSGTPAVQIVEGGVVIPPNAVFTRSVAPAVRVSDPTATVTSTLNGNPFTNGDTVTADGSYTLHATASDAAGHTGEATATFSIDTTAPAVAITSPADGAVIHAGTATVTGSATGDVARLTVNGTEVSRAADSTFTTAVSLDLGGNVILAVAYDAAGNSRAASVSVTRDDGGSGMVITSPATKSVTNHPKVSVTGQIVTPANAQSLTVNGQSVPFDSAGAFRLDGLSLTEGLNTITATLTAKNGATSSLAVTVTADFTAPKVTVRANGAPLDNGTRFATPPSIAVEVTDSDTATVNSLTIDGVLQSSLTATGLAAGGHALTAQARDSAGNLTRIDRTFSIGDSSGASSGGCPPSTFDPAGGSTVFGSSVLLTGRAGAPQVLIGTAVTPVADGSFRATVQLNSEGANTISVACADAGGAILGTAVSLTLYRFNNAPSVSITSPATDSELVADHIEVVLSAGPGVTGGDVNGITFRAGGDLTQTRSVTVSNVTIANGLNIITARVHNDAGRSGSASVQVRRYAGDPSITITSPIAGTQTGAAAIDVSGNYRNIDPASIVVTARNVTFPVIPVSSSDTSGTFRAAGVTLAADQPTAITVSAHTRAGAPVSASVTVQNTAGAPSIVITSPADNTVFRSDAPAPAVSGTFSAGNPPVVQVNGATLSPAATSFATTVPFASSGGFTPIVARVQNPDGGSASHGIRIARFAAPFAVTAAFPSAGAAEVDPGIMVVATFNNDVDKSSVVPGVLRLTDGGGQETTGIAFVDRDAISFAPRAPLAGGTTYTFTISTGLRDLAGGSLASPYTLTFSTSTGAPATGPVVSPTDVDVCAATYNLTGTAAVAGARVQLVIDGFTRTATAASNRTFAFAVDLQGVSGYHVARLRELGADGTLSPESDVTIHAGCTPLHVAGATLDRAAKKLTIQFSKPMNASTLTASATGSIQLAPGGSAAVDGTVSLDASGTAATVTTTADLSAPVITLLVKAAVQDAAGTPLGTDYTQVFSLTGDTPIEPGKGLVSGAVYDASTGRALPGAGIDIEVPLNAFSHPGPRLAVQSAGPRLAANDTGAGATDTAGRYSRSLAEGAYTIHASATGYTDVWRQIIVPVGAGIVPIDIRLTRRGTAQTIASAGSTLTTPADGTVSHRADLTVPGALAGKSVTLTSAGAQSLAGLLPLGWSPLAAAEVYVAPSAAPSALSGATLKFTLTSSEVAALAAARQTLTIVEYDADRDEWRSLGDVAPEGIASDGLVTVSLQRSGDFALVYPDRAAGLQQPLPAAPGAPLQGVKACTASPCLMTSAGFTLDPETVTPSQATTATLKTAGVPAWPSGTAVQAYIDEQLNLADGRVSLDAPFATDLLVYRTIAGDLGQAVFHLAPTAAAAAEALLKDGVDHIRVVDYPGRVDRGASIGSEGGRVPGDGSVTLDIPAGAAPQPVTANVAAADVSALGTIAGFHVAGAFILSLTSSADVSQSPTGTLAPPVLLKPARATFSVDDAKFASSNRQVIVAEVVNSAAYGTLLRLAAVTTLVPSDATGKSVYTTRATTAAELPADGIVRDGRYVILTADAPIAFAWGQVRYGDATAPAAANVRVFAGTGNPQSALLGVTDVSRATGVFAIPVAARTAPLFSLVAFTTSTGYGDVTGGAATPDPDTFVPFGTLPLVVQPLADPLVTPSGSVDANGAFSIQAKFAVTLDPASAGDAMTVVNTANAQAVAGSAAAAGDTITFNRTGALSAGTTYAVVLQPSVRSATGRALGHTFVAHFSTNALPPATVGVHPELIRITMPDAAGRSKVIGLAGALPAGATALPLRRGRTFLTAYQDSVKTDGSFLVTLGDGANDIVTTADTIDLDVIDPVSHAVIAIVPLTPFTTDDNNGVLAPVGVTTRFTSALGVTLTIPAGSFSVPTLVTVAPAEPAGFSSVPSFDQTLHFNAGVRVDFAGTSAQRIDVEIPALAGADPSKSYYLGYLGTSIRGPRVELVDLVRLSAGKFLTSFASASGSSAKVHGLSVTKAGQSTFSSADDVKALLLGVVRPAAYAVVDLTVATGWVEVQSFANSIDLFWDTIASLYVSHYTLNRTTGRALIPVAANQPFRLVGVDASTGLQNFAKIYDGPSAGTPIGDVTKILSGDTASGPYPVFASAGRIEIVDAPDALVELTSVRNLKIKATADHTVVIRDGSPRLPDHAEVHAVNLTNGQQADCLNGCGSNGVSLPASHGDRLVMEVDDFDVDPFTAISVTFNKPIDAGGDTSADALATYFKSRLYLTMDDGPQTGPAAAVSNVKYSIDSDGRRINLDAGAALKMGKRYHLVLDASLADKTGLKLFQSKVDGNTTGGLQSGTQFSITFTVRAPGGKLASFDMSSISTIHDMSLNGNIAFVAAGSGGLEAYDISDPVSLKTGDNGQAPEPLAGAIDCTQDPSKAYSCGYAFWAVASDHHNRVFTTGMSGVTGTLRTYRIKDFESGQSSGLDWPKTAVRGTDDNGARTGRGSIISWVPGYSTYMPLGTETTLSDRPEAIPRRIQILLQDDDVKLSRDAVKSRYAATAVADLKNGYQKFTLHLRDDLPPSNPGSYQLQTVTLENRTLNIRWSADIRKGQPATMTGVIAGPTDDLHVYVNRSTYAVVALMGYGIGVYDVNAMESNRNPVDTGYVPLKEIVGLGDGKLQGNDPDHIVECDQAAAAFAGQGQPCRVNDLTFSADALLRPDDASPNVQVFALQPRQGVLDGWITPPVVPAPIADPNHPAGVKLKTVQWSYGWWLTNPYSANGTAQSFDHPRLQTLRKIYRQNAKLTPSQAGPSAHYLNIAYYARPVSDPKQQSKVDEYALIASYQYGLLVWKLAGNGTLGLADVVWVPAGVVSVRVLPRGDLAVAVDGAGRVLVIDLKRVDELSKVGPLPRCSGPECLADLFPTALKALSADTPALQAGATWSEVGVDDPRILWKSEPGTVKGTLAPLVDPDTGIVFTGDAARTTINVIAATDPRVKFMVNVGDATGYRETGAIVPLGVKPPQFDSATGADFRSPDASLAAFRVELWLPGSVTKQLKSQELRMAVESERVPNGVTGQTASPWPRAHLRRSRPDGTYDTRAGGNFAFKLDRLFPFDENDADMKPLKYQEGFNHFVTPWIVALADPRASIDYKNSDWTDPRFPDRKAKLGCDACDRPAFLKDKTEVDDHVYEIFANGHYLAAHPEICASASSTCTAAGTIFTGTGYDYLGKGNRLVGRVKNIVADTVRPTNVITAAQSAPMASGALQDTTFVHSGEVSTGTADLDAGGRAGFDVIFDRTYRSRTLGTSNIGFGWEAAMFARLRELPDNSVELRDGSGEVWRFNVQSSGYDAPAGMNAQLIRSADGTWTLLDEKLRQTSFDALGRLISERDQFFDGHGGGNEINYYYDVNGRLSQISDPVKRITNLTWCETTDINSTCFEGMVRDVTDWRGRKITFHYDTFGRLTQVERPDRTNGTYPDFEFKGANRPKVRYTYHNGNSPFDLQDYLGTAANLETITEPGDTTPRVTFAYFESGPTLDMVSSQKWGTGDQVQASFDYDVRNAFTFPVTTTVTDAYGQKRTYDFTTATTSTFPDFNNARPQIQTVDESVPVWQAAGFGKLPDALTLLQTSSTPASRKRRFTYDGNGLLLTAAPVDGSDGATVTYGYQKPDSTPKGGSLNLVKSAAGGTTARTSMNIIGGFVDSVIIDGVGMIEVKEPHRAVDPKGGEKPKSIQTDGSSSITTTTNYNPDGTVKDSTSAGGTDTAAGAANASGRNEYYNADDPNVFQRALPENLFDGDGDLLSTNYEYSNNGDTVKVTSPRSVTTTTDFDGVGHPIHVKVDGPESNPEENYAYDARGRLVRHLRQQGQHHVEDRFEYDILGRQISHSIYEDDGLKETTTTTYDMAQRKVTTTLPPSGAAQATITEHLDPLGRVFQRDTDPNEPGHTSTITELTAYDIEGNAVYSTDGKTAAATQFDGDHRPTRTLALDGTTTDLTVDGAGRTRTAKTQSHGQTLLDYSASYTPTGLTQNVAVNGSSQSFAWDGAGRTTTATLLSGAEQTRTSHSTYDTAGRLTESFFGEGTNGVATKMFGKSSLKYDGPRADLPTSVQSSDLGSSAPINWTLIHDTLGRTTNVSHDGSGFGSEQHFDEAGNTTSVKSPAQRGQNTYDYDGRGFMTAENMPGAKNTYTPDSAGLLKTYTDPAGQDSGVEHDGLGRVVKRTYPDGSSEEVFYDGSRLDRIKDRQKHFQHFVYDDPATGRLLSVRRDDGTDLDALAYDDAGRLKSWKTPGVLLEFSNFDVNSNPQQIKQTRLDDAGAPIDSYLIGHSWNAAGELKHTALPVLDALAGPKWISAIDYHYDGAGNVDTVTAGGLTVNSIFRAPGRPTDRSLNLPGGRTLRRTYSYDDATGSVGRLNGMHASVDGALFGGSDITFDGDTVLRKQINLAGLSGGTRSNTYGYDDRGRLTGALMNTTAAGNAAQAGPAGGSTVDLTVADFRTSLERGGSTASTVTTESTAGHKVAALAKGGVAQPRLYQNADGSEGGVLSDDGRYVYTFDEKGRLTHVTQKLLGATSNLLRVRYYYNGVGRLAGRHVELAPVTNNTLPGETDWTLATAAQVAGQPLPAATSFVWDPVTDQLLAIYAEGTGGNPGTLLRQFVHGGLGLDDPVEVIAADPAGQNVTRMYPIYDEAGAGSLQAIVGEDGSLLARDLQKDPYGEDTVAIAAPVVDKVSIAATKETDGTLNQVSVTLRSTEPLDATTAAAGGRLASVTATGTVVHTSTAQPTLSSDGFTLTWTLTAADWTALTTQGSASQAPAALSVAATSTLRSTTYGIGTPVLPATPEMLAKGNVYSTSALPLEIREPLTLVSSSLISAGSETPYELTDLAAAGIPLAALTGDPTNGMLISPFQAQPFADPFTGKTYVRARWYDPGTGTWLSPDPLSYRDSANLYAFAGGDPVNGSDPTGLADGYLGGVITDDLSIDPQAIDHYAEEAKQWAKRKVDSISNPQARGAAQSLEDLPDTVSVALVTRANPPVGVGLVTKGLVDCWNQNTWAHAGPDPSIGEHASASVNALVDCTAGNWYRGAFGWDPYGNRVSPERQAVAQGKAAGGVVHTAVFVGIANAPRASTRPSESPVVFQNLFPEDLPSPRSSSTLQFRDGRWREVTPTGDVRTAEGSYNFVRIGNRVYLGRNSAAIGRGVGHVDLAKGGEVSYAGEVRFGKGENRGQIRSWSNASGHYRPNPAKARQAGFPLELFEPVDFGTPFQAGVPAQ